jgi:hypothetical protein
MLAGAIVAQLIARTARPGGRDTRVTTRLGL